MSHVMKDTYLDYQGPLGQHSRCRLRLYRLADETMVAICTELLDNPGMSVTNAADIIASLVRQTYAQHGQAILFFEHQLAGRYGGHHDPETFDRILPASWDGSQYHEVTWRPSSRAEVEQLLGCSL